MANGELTPRRAADPDNQTNGRWCSADATDQYPGGTCGNYPIKGGNVCKRSHGGAAKQVMRKAAERIQEAEAEQVLAKHKTSLGGGRMPISNSQALLWMLEEAAFNVVFYQNRLQELRQGKGGKNEEGTFEEGLYSYIPEVGTIEHIWWRKYDQERDRLFRIAADCKKLGLDERLLEIENDKIEALVAALVAGWKAVGLTLEQQEIAQAAVWNKLREIRQLSSVG